ncbi:MAG: alanine racemase [Cyanobacteria bacterium SIG28]|nr:alanine racemase [Cyanobacteria bacterium SIG28]
MMKNIRQSNINIHKDAWVEINLEHLAQNIVAIKDGIPKNKKMMAIVKADAYGHGAQMLAKTMLASGVDMFGVSSVDEGLDLRSIKITEPILVVGAVPTWAFETATKNDISISIFNEEHLNACKQTFQRIGIKPKVHVKIDTGMNRIGVRAEEAVEFIETVNNSDFVEFVGVFTHLAAAEEQEFTREQVNTWQEIIAQIDTKNLILHIQNTAATFAFDIDTNMVRVGISLYGLYPDLPEKIIYKPSLKPVMSLKGRITNIHELKPGESVSYGHTYTAYETTRIATIPIGYADGVSRRLSNKIQAKLNGKIITQVGNITMDQMMFDIGDIDANVGDVVTLLDEDLTIDNWAKILETINYELTCRLKVRLPRVYVR